MIPTFRLDLQISTIFSRHWDRCWSCPQSRTFGAASWPGALTSSDTQFSPRLPSQVSLNSEFAFRTHAAIHFPISLLSSPVALNLPLRHAPTPSSHIAPSFTSHRLEPSHLSNA
jgi:hypothetical protein